MRELVEDKEYKLVKGEQTPRPSRHQYFLHIITSTPTTILLH